MREYFRWLPFLGFRTIDQKEALDMFELTVEDGCAIRAFTFEWLWLVLIFAGKVIKETK